MALFKAYDIRGIYGKDLTDEIAYKIGKAIVEFLKCEKIALGWDMRKSTPNVCFNFVKGVTEMGCDVINLDRVCSDAVYFASGKLNIPAVMVTASHNPSEYNGLKFCLAGGKPLGLSNGLDKVKELVERDEFNLSKTRGKISEYDVLPDYVEHVRTFIDVSNLKPLKIAADAGNGMAGKIVPLVFERLNCEILPLYFELDGRFPNHPANPSIYENLKDLQKIVVEKKCDFGMAFDGDADRVTLIDEKGEIIDASFLSALIAEKLIKDNPKSTIVYNLVLSNIVPETVKKLGAIPILEKVGHSSIKKTMREKNAIFGCEAAAHYFYRDHYFADSAMITVLIVAELVSVSGKSLSELVKPYQKYFKIEETNLKVEDKDEVISKLKAHYSSMNPKKVITIDGLRVDFEDWWFCVRASNTEPLLRLNLETKSEELMEEKKEEIVSLIQS